MKKYNFEEFKETMETYGIVSAYKDSEIYEFMKAQSNFSSTIKKFKDYNTPEGDFARDYIADNKKPRAALNILRHLLNLNACDNAVCAYFNIVEKCIADIKGSK